MISFMYNLHVFCKLGMSPFYLTYGVCVCVGGRQDWIYCMHVAVNPPCSGLPNTRWRSRYSNKLQSENHRRKAETVLEGTLSAVREIFS